MRTGRPEDNGREVMGQLPWARDRRGAIYVEYIVTMLPFFTLLSFTLQTASSYADSLIVQAAASSAARTASRALPACPDHGMGGQPVNEINFDTNHECEGRLHKLLETIGLLGVLPSEVPRPTTCRGDARHAAIADSANQRLLATVPHPERLIDHLANWGSLGDGDIEVKSAFGADVYLKGMVAVTYPDHEDNRNPEFARDENVRVRVTYLAYCSTPLVSMAMCSTLSSLRSSEAYRRLRDHAEYPRILDWLERVSPNNRFMVLESEATLTNNGRASDCPNE